MTFLKPLKAQQAFRMILENVKRYRANEITYKHFYFRASWLWRYVQVKGFNHVVEPAYLAKMR